MRSARVTAVICGSIALSVSLPGAAGADPQVGTCTSSYTLYNERSLAKIDPAVTADLFAIIDTNDNGLICFKPYPNGDHNGHGGNLVDDKSGTQS